MNEAQLRAQFEKLVRDKPDQRYTLDQVLPGIYKDKEVHAAWEGYLAGYAARAAAPPRPPYRFWCEQHGALCEGDNTSFGGPCRNRVDYGPLPTVPSWRTEMLGDDAAPPEGETNVSQNGNCTTDPSVHRVCTDSGNAAVASPAMSAERFYNQIYCIGREDPLDTFKFAEAYAAALTAEVERLRGALQEISVRSDALVRDEHVSKTFAAGMLGEHARAALESTTPQGGQEGKP